MAKAQSKVVQMPVMNNSGLRPFEYNVIVHIPAAEAQTKGGVILSETSVDRSEIDRIDGVIVALPDRAFDFLMPEGANYDRWVAEVDLPQVGDRIMFPRYAGHIFRGKDGERYRIMKDKDVLTVVDGDWDLDT